MDPEKEAGPYPQKLHTEGLPLRKPEGRPSYLLPIFIAAEA
jgi:hypothetical protein